MDDMTSHPLADRVLAAVPPLDRPEQAEKLDALADALSHGNPVDCEVAQHLRALASVLRF